MPIRRALHGQFNIRSRFRVAKRRRKGESVTAFVISCYNSWPRLEGRGRDRRRESSLPVSRRASLQLCFNLDYSVRNYFKIFTDPRGGTALARKTYRKIESYLRRGILFVTVTVKLTQPRRLRLGRTCQFVIKKSLKLKSPRRQVFFAFRKINAGVRVRNLDASRRDLSFASTGRR